ncbi:hypothetical protein ACLBWP_17730 [Microbacterium sp. M1A1_1b]
MNWGTTMHRTRLTAFAGAVAAVLVLAGCATGAAVTGTSANPTTAAPTTSASATASDTSGTPRPSSTITAAPGSDDDAGTVPATCDGLITAGKWDFTSAPLNDPAVVGDPVVRPKSAFDTVVQPDGKRLYCVWKDPRTDISYLSIAVDVVDSARALGALQALQGYDCDHDAEGYRCQRVTTDEQYQVPVGDTYFTRGDIGIEINQANVPTTGLLDDVMAHVF